MNKMNHNPVYIVDDDPDDRQIINDAFEANQITSQVMLIENGYKLMEDLQKQDVLLPGLILLDLNMPGKDGREVLKEVKGNKLWRHIPIVIFTTSSFDKDRESCYELGANCFVTKPSNYNKLVDTIRYIRELWLTTN
ncbi:MAG TPA: response regulator [Flavitalea sp.]|nr:response regulator [Flavitalea sp.]